MHTTLGGRNFAVAAHEYRTIRPHFELTPDVKTTKPTRSVIFAIEEIDKANTRTDGLRKEARSDREEAPEKMEQTSIRYVQVRALSMEETQGYRQPSSETV